MKVVGHPKFDDIVRNYALIHHPEWLLKEVVYKPAPESKFTAFNSKSKSTFGNKYQTTICLEVQKYILFFITCVVFFVILTLTL